MKFHVCYLLVFLIHSIFCCFITFVLTMKVSVSLPVCSKLSIMFLTGGVAETPCPYKCVSDRYHMPHCFTALEELIYTFGGPWLFGLLLSGLLVLLALVLSIARMKFVGNDELPGPAPTQHSSQIDHSFPFLESLNEVVKFILYTEFNILLSCGEINFSFTEISANGAGIGNKQSRRISLSCAQDVFHGPKHLQ